MSELNYFVHPQALCESKNIGKDTRIWAFAHVLPGAVIGEDCNICDYCFVENKVKLGNRVTVKNSISIWDGITIEDDVFLGPNCVLTNDLVPRSKAHKGITPTLIKRGASIGANATILCGINIGKYAMVAAGAVVTKDVPDYALMVGNPARIKAWISKTGEKLDFTKSNPAVDSKGNRYALVRDDKNNEFITPL